MSGFQFKQFKIEQDRCAMKVGTDGVLVGSWCSVANVHRVLDVGSGTGLIALMVAQRTTTDCHITGIEIDAEAARQAQENVDASPWSSRVNIECIRMQDYNPSEPIDLIVSNPPYFTNALKAPDEKRSTARHNDSLSISELVHFAKAHMSENGRLSVVLPCEEAERLIFESMACGLYLQHKTFVKTKANKHPKRMLVEVGRLKIEPIEDTLVMAEGANNELTEEFKGMVREFYLKV